MLKRNYKYKGINIQELHYVPNLEEILRSEKFYGVDVLKVYQTSSNYKNNFNPFHTLHINLNVPEEEIFKKFKSNYRNEINKNMRDDNVLMEYIENPSVEEIRTFLKDLKEFSNFKGYNVNYKFEMQRSIDFQKNIAITHIRLNNEARDKIASHMYYIDGNNRARLKSSVSYRMDENIDPKLVGRSNKALHWFDMQELKKRGIAICDLGGAIRVDESGKILSGGISGFKKGFSNNLVTEYSGEIPLTLKGRIAIAAWKFMRKRKS